MKAISEPVVRAFDPVTITITIESQAELDAFGTLFNAGAICDCLSDVFGGVYFGDIFRVVERRGGDINKVEALCAALAKHRHIKQP